MGVLGLLICGLLIQNITAQVLPFVSRNAVPGPNIIAAQPQNIIANNLIPNNGIGLSRAVQNGLPIANGGPNAVAGIANALNENAATIAANQEIAGAINNANLATLANTNLNGLNANLAALANANLASINGNMATFNLGNTGFTLTSGSPGSPSFGIQVLADALEVGGTVAVNGQIPIYGTVAVNGQLPTDGSASVSYTCGRPNAPVIV